MFTTTTRDDGSTLTLELSGDLTLEHGCELRSLLLSHKDSPRLRISVNNATRMDLTFVQLLQALMRSRERDHLLLEFAPLPDVLVSLGAALGASNLMKDITDRTVEAA